LGPYASNLELGEPDSDTAADRADVIPPFGVFLRRLQVFEHQRRIAVSGTWTEECAGSDLPTELALDLCFRVFARRTFPQQPRADVIITGSLPDEDAKKAYPEGWRAARPSLRFVPQPGCVTNVGRV
jgi:hypothetical protein